MTVAGGFGVVTPPATLARAAELSDADWSRLSGELARSSRPNVLHDAHVVAWSVQRLASLAARYLEQTAESRGNQSPAEARSSLESIAAAARSLAAMLEEMSPLARANFEQGLFHVGRGREDGARWAPGSLRTLGDVASAGATMVRVSAGRRRTMGRQRLLCGDISRIVERHGLTLSQGAGFYKVCTVVFAIARIPGQPRDAIRSLQDDEKQRQSYRAWELLQHLKQERE